MPHAAITLSLFLLAPLFSFAQTPLKGDRPVEILVGSNPGTGTDKAARMIQRIWQQEGTLNAPSVVVNKPGGGGAVSWAYLNQHQGDNRYLLVTSYNIVTNQITGRSALTYTDFTPISLLMSEYIAYSVKLDSKIKGLGEALAMLKKDPRALSIGLSSSVGGANHIALGLLTKAAGIELNKMRVVIFNSGGESLTALLGGHVDIVVASGSAIASQVEAGTIRALAFTAPKRLMGPFASVPTLAELGYPVTADNWRIVIGAKGLTPENKQFWDGMFKRLAASAEWNKELETNYLSNNYLDSEGTRKYLDVQYSEIKSVLTELGLAKPAIKP